MAHILNITAYKFTNIADREDLRDLLSTRAELAQLRGTILLSTEGINMCLAGEATLLRAFLAMLIADARFADLTWKESWCDKQPFRRFLAKLKNEIIRMNHPAIQPASGRAHGVVPTTLKRWLDQGHDDTGKPVVMLDMRNAFEVDYGTFNGAINWRITKFTDFPTALAAHKHELYDKTVVSFCTGGIRCEKGSILMREMGLDNVLQLEGGILKYFEEIGAAHYTGDCFVFDGREALSPSLQAKSSYDSARVYEDPDWDTKKTRWEADNKAGLTADV
ncbi:MAG: sulfurtransferase [Burkholderiaceae bacterium]